jgi:SAM-dependent methyltransferase
MPIRANAFHICADRLSNKSGLEIGGTSQVFSKQGLFPAYPIVGQLDNCNFGDTTVWEGAIQEGLTFQFDPHKPAGRQYVIEATDMGRIQTAHYDFVLSSHVLEHSANPILALSEWLRVLKTGGTLVMLLPHKEGTFDHRRPVTTLAHLIKDFEQGMKEDDLTHMPEILALHDLALDPHAGDFAAFKARSEHNAENRCFHQHVFDTEAAVNLVNYMGLQIHAVEAIRPMHILVVAEKLVEGTLPDNAQFAKAVATYRHTSPFLSDRT